jgi:hypothetical protein
MISDEALAMQQVNIIVMKSQRVARSFDGKPGIVQCVIDMRDNPRRLEALNYTIRMANRRRQQEQ